MLRTEAYIILQKIGNRAERAAGVATSMLVSGCRSMDAELRRLRGDAGDELLRLSLGVASSPFAVGEAVATVRLGTELCRVLDGAAETAVLLRGRALRAWSPFDRVRTTATLTTALSAVVGLLGKCSEHDMHASLGAFCEESGRLARLTERSYEGIVATDECTATLALAAALDRWRDAIDDAYGFAVGLL